MRHADRTELAPWRPRILAAPDQILKFAAAVYAAILGYNFLLMSSPDGVVSAAMAGVVFNCWKRYHFFPVDSGELQKRIDGGWRNLFRCALLGWCAARSRSAARWRTLRADVRPASIR